MRFYSNYIKKDKICLQENIQKTTLEMSKNVKSDSYICFGFVLAGRFLFWLAVFLFWLAVFCFGWLFFLFWLAVFVLAGCLLFWLAVHCFVLAIYCFWLIFMFSVRKKEY
jgi:hypothetical protein